MDAPITRPSNIDKMLLAGTYSFRRTKRAKPVQVDVDYVLGQCTLTFADGTERLAKDVVPGWPEWREHFERIR